jgi:hypothetical protein
MVKQMGRETDVMAMRYGEAGVAMMMTVVQV